MIALVASVSFPLSQLSLHACGREEGRGERGRGGYV